MKNGGGVNDAAGDHRFSSAGSTALLLLAFLATSEILSISLLHGFLFANFSLAEPPYAYFVHQLGRAAVASVAVLAVMSWPKRHALAESWLTQVRDRRFRLPFVVNITLFVGLTIANVEFSRHVATIGQAYWSALYSAHLATFAIVALSLMWLAAPFRFWQTVVADRRLDIAMAVTVGLLAMLAGVLAQRGWGDLASFTLRASHGLLSSYETDVRVDYDQRLLGVGDFSVLINDACSGYEGIGMVAAVLGLFLWAFRRSLLFPNALVLLPIGICAIWLLNIARIAVLVSLGAHVSPNVAAIGFHSQAGWVAFLLVTGSVMMTAPRLTAFGSSGRHNVWSTRDRLILAFLAPFMSLMAATILVAAFAPYDIWLYGLKVATVGVCLWIFRDVYIDVRGRLGAFEIACGAIVGVIWILSMPDGKQDGAIDGWIAAQPVWLATVWLAIRIIGSVVTVPIAEELAFRGLLYRWLISRRFENVAFGQFSWLAFVASSLLFGFMHQRWIAGTLAGAVFALLMHHSGRLSAPIAAHMTANAVIVAWAIAAQNWSVL